MSGIIVVDGNSAETVIDHEFAKRCAERLEQKYPGYVWGVHSGGGVTQVRLLDSYSDMGFVHNHSRSYSSSAVDHDIDMLAGELLERYRLKRGAADHSEIATAKRDFAGRMILER